MGDRCFMWIKCRKEDADKFEDFDLDNEENGVAYLIDEDRNYADTDDLPRDVLFFGGHYDGDNYGPGVFACDGKDFVEVDAQDGWPVVRVNASGPQLDSLCEIAHYYQVSKAARRHVEGGELMTLHRFKFMMALDEKGGKVVSGTLGSPGLDALVLSAACSGLDVQAPAFQEAIIAGWNATRSDVRREELDRLFSAVDAMIDQAERDYESDPDGVPTSCIDAKAALSVLRAMPKAPPAVSSPPPIAPME